MKTRSVVTAAALLAAPVACNRLGPSGFWTRHHADLIVFQENHQGPWGGHRVIHWAHAKASTFTEASARAFAERNGWKFVDSTPVLASELRTWVVRPNSMVFVLFGRDDQKLCLQFPRHIHTNSIVLKFETGWVRVEPGTGQSSPAHGYVQIDEEGKSMAVYHLWGEA